MVLRLGDQCTDLLPYRIGKSGFFLIPILRRVIRTLQLTGSSLHRSDNEGRMLLVGLYCRFVFPIKLFRVRFSLLRSALVYLGLQQNVPVTVFLLSFSLFR